jgi:hypothetical protein
MQHVALTAVCNRHFVHAAACSSGNDNSAKPHCADANERTLRDDVYGEKQPSIGGTSSYYVCVLLEIKRAVVWRGACSGIYCGALQCGVVYYCVGGATLGTANIRTFPIFASAGNGNGKRNTECIKPLGTTFGHLWTPFL